MRRYVIHNRGEVKVLPAGVSQAGGALSPASRKFAGCFRALYVIHNPCVLPFDANPPNPPDKPEKESWTVRIPFQEIFLSNIFKLLHGRCIQRLRTVHTFPVHSSLSPRNSTVARKP